MVMVVVIIYLVLKNHQTPAPSRFSTPLHFTIPVLSPFTSVVSDLESNLHISSLVTTYPALLGRTRDFGHERTDLGRRFSVRCRDDLWLFPLLVDPQQTTIGALNIFTLI